MIKRTVKDKPTKASGKPMTKWEKPDSGEEIVAGSVLAYADIDLRDIPENDGLCPLTLAVALTTDGHWIPVYSIDDEDGSNWIRPSAASVAKLGHIIVADWTYAGMPDLDAGRKLFRRWAAIVSEHEDLNGSMSVSERLEELADRAYPAGTLPAWDEREEARELESHRAAVL